MASRRSLHSVLQDGEVVQFKHGPHTYQSYFQAGLLISTEDPKKTFTSPTGFANDCSKSSINGWLHCKVLRDGQWHKLADLPQVAYVLQEQPPAIVAAESPAPKDGPTIKIKRMPPKGQSTAKKALPPVHQYTIIANVLEPAEPAIEVTAVRRITLKPLTVDSTDYWLLEDKVYERTPSGARGPYVGRWNCSSIDREAPDSEDEGR
jgi:hypothetical protein